MLISCALSDLPYQCGTGSSNLLSMEVTDRILISRLSLDPNSMTDDPIMATVYASLPQESPFEYLTLSWLRAIEQRSKVITATSSAQDRLRVVDRARELIISYIGLTMQDPDMFPNSKSPESGAIQLINLLTRPAPSHPLTPHIWTLVYELAHRFEGDGLEEIIGPVISQIALDNNLRLSKWHVGGHEWRVPVRVLGDLMEVKPIAKMVSNLKEWMPIDQRQPGGKQIEFFWLLGPVLALSTFPDRAVRRIHILSFIHVFGRLTDRPFEQNSLACHS